VSKRDVLNVYYDVLNCVVLSGFGCDEWIGGVRDVLVMRVGRACGRYSGAWWYDVMLMVRYGSVLVAWWYDVMLIV